MSPILNSTTGMIPQVMESPELIELLHQLNALEPLSDVTVATSLSSSGHLQSETDGMEQSRDNVHSEHPALLVLVRKLTELLLPYRDEWSFEESVRSLFAVAVVWFLFDLHIRLCCYDAFVCIIRIVLTVPAFSVTLRKSNRWIYMTGYDL